MSIIKYVERLRRIDSLIVRRSTGAPCEFAERLGIKRSTLFRYLQDLRRMGTDIRYSAAERTYYYADDRRIYIKIDSLN